jgi:hypothetical protein
MTQLCPLVENARAAGGPDPGVPRGRRTASAICTGDGAVLAARLVDVERHCVPVRNTGHACEMNASAISFASSISAPRRRGLCRSRCCEWGTTSR